MLSVHVGPYSTYMQDCSTVLPMAFPSVYTHINKAFKTCIFRKNMLHLKLKPLYKFSCMCYMVKGNNSDMNYYSRNIPCKYM